MQKRLAWISLIVLSSCSDPPPPPDPCKVPLLASDSAAPPPTHTPRWAFEPWISKDISDTDDTYAFVEGFASRNIPVGVVVLDSPWETQYTTFTPNPVRYHDFPKLVSDLHARNIKLVLWTTQMINDASIDIEPGGDHYDGKSPNFDQAVSCKYSVDNADTYFWWKGTGLGVDFFSPYAMAWWHRQQDQVLELGVDGWKLDFGDSYLLAEPVLTAGGTVEHQAYTEAYYRDFLAYGIAKRGRDFTTLVRGWDASYGFKGRFYAKKEDAPVVWAGDNRRDWVGLADALDTMFRSARAGYVVVGSDIGGYLDIDDQTRNPVPFSQATFARWTAVGALSPFMELHGRANLAPWTVPERADETVTLYRYWATLHHELVPFFYSLTEQAYAGGPPLLDPIGDEAAWAGDYRYTLGGALLVAPILDDTGKRDIALPAGSRWYDWWAPAADALAGGQTIAAYDATDRTRLPLFVREGAILPQQSSIAVYPGPSESKFDLLDEDDQKTTIGTSASAGAYAVSLSRVRGSGFVSVRADRAVTSVTVDGAAIAAAASRAELAAAASGWYADTANRTVWVKLAVSEAPHAILLAVP
jgi:alpha-D-xyloside xylohydrolase